MIDSLLSVIIPVFNVENYLSRCVDSVLDQTYPSIEIILINDGSTDASKLICENYERNYSNIKVLHKKNKGQAEARNDGLDIAKGEYIAFVDSDDWINPKMYETLINLLQETKSDISSSSFYEVYPHYKVEQNNTGVISIYNKDEAIQNLLFQNQVRFEVWNKVFTRKIVSNVRFKSEQLHEEVFFIRKVFLNMSSMSHIDIPLYNYVKEREGNTNSNFRINKLAVFDELSSFLTELNKLKLYKAEKHICLYAIRFCLSLYIQATYHDMPMEVKNRIINQYKQYYKSINGLQYIKIKPKEKIKLYLFFHFPNEFAKLIYLKNKSIRKETIN